jgi:hypothetical protein
MSGNKKLIVEDVTDVLSGMVALSMQKLHVLMRKTNKRSQRREQTEKHVNNMQVKQNTTGRLVTK